MDKEMEKALFILEFFVTIRYSDLSVKDAYDLLISEEGGFKKFFSEFRDFENRLRQSGEIQKLIEEVKKKGYNLETNLAEDMEKYYSELKKSLKKAIKIGKGLESCVSTIHPERMRYIS